jgi:hypothetical protein
MRNTDRAGNIKLKKRNFREEKRMKQKSEIPF